MSQTVALLKSTFPTMCRSNPPCPFCHAATESTACFNCHRSLSNTVKASLPSFDPRLLPLLSSPLVPSRLRLGSIRLFEQERQLTFRPAEEDTRRRTRLCRCVQRRRRRPRRYRLSHKLVREIPRQLAPVMGDDALAVERHLDRHVCHLLRHCRAFRRDHARGERPARADRGRPRWAGLDV